MRALVCREGATRRSRAPRAACSAWRTFPPWTRPPREHPGPRHLRLAQLRGLPARAQPVPGEARAAVHARRRVLRAVLELGAELQKGGPFRVGQVVAGAVVGAAPWRRSWSMPDERVRVRRPRWDFPSRRVVVPHRVRHGVHGAGAARARRAGDACAGARRGGGVGLAVQIAKALGAVVSPRGRGGGESRGVPRRRRRRVPGQRRAARVVRHEAHECIPKKKEGDVRVAPAATRAAARREISPTCCSTPWRRRARGLSSIRWGGQALVIGFASGSIPALPLNVALVKNITVHGVYWGDCREGPGADETMRDAGEGGLLARGSLVPKVDVSATAPLERAHRAFAALERRRVVGKAVVVVSREEEAMRATRGGVP